MKAIILILLCSLFFLISCKDIIVSTYEGISFRNETDYEIEVSFIYDSGNKDLLKMPEKRTYNGFILYTYDYNKKVIMDSTVLLNQIKKLKIYKIVRNYTIYVNPIHYNKFKNWTEYIAFDMRNRANEYIFSVKNDMFE